MSPFAGTRPKHGTSPNAHSRRPSGRCVRAQPDRGENEQADFDDDGSTDATGAKASHTYTTAGAYQPKLTVTDTGGQSSTVHLSVVAGNTRPVVTIETPDDGTFSEFGEPIPFKVDDPEEGTVDCTKVKVTYQLGHNQHGHPMAEATPDANCEGTLLPGRDAEHGPGAYVFHIVDAAYTDHGSAQGAPPLTGEGDIVLHPRQYSADTYQKGVGVGNYFGQNLFVPRLWGLVHVPADQCQGRHRVVHGTGHPAGRNDLHRARRLPRGSGRGHLRRCAVHRLDLA